MFYALSRVGPAWLSIGGSFIAALIVFWYNRENRVISWLTVFGFVVVAAGAVVGIALNSEKAYLAAGAVQDFLFAPILIGSILIRKPLVGGIARELVPAIARRIPPDAAVFMWLSVLWAFFNLAQGFVRLYMLQELSIGEYLIWSRVAFWPISSVMVLLTATLIFREAKKIALRNGEPVPSLAMLLPADKEPLPVPVRSGSE